MNLAEQEPARVEEMQKRYETWNRKNITPLWEDPHLENVEIQENARLETVRRASAGERK